jgi:hypothetical protein
MSSKHDDWKVWKLFTVAAVAAVVMASLSKAASVEAQAMTEPTIDERIAKIREELKQRNEQIKREFDLLPSFKDNQEPSKDKTLQAQWNNWNNWGDGPWNNWNDWKDQPWNNWCNEPWCDWNDKPGSDSPQ